MLDWIMVLILTIFIVVEFYYEEYIYHYRIHVWIDEYKKPVDQDEKKA